MPSHKYYRELQRERKQLLCELNKRCSEHHRCDRVHYIRQSDFDNGTLIIDRPGVYKVVEDIVLDFYPDNDYRPPSSESRPAFFLGFFAGIIVETADVCIDLCSHSIRMSESFALQQRFFAIIELASAPFIPTQGPGNFGSNVRSASYTMIRNGTLGRSSHHGIHGNGAHNLAIKNLTIKDFEVAGIALNGGHHLAFNCLDIGPNWKNVPVLGNYSAARFIGQFVRNVMDKGTEEEKDYLNDKLDDLQKLMDQVLDDVKNGRKVSVPLFANETGLPDGNNYGLLIHPIGVAINDYIDNDYGGKLTNHVFVDDVKTHDIRSEVLEIVGLSEKGGKGVQRDPSGSVFQIERVTDENGKFKSNPLAELQIALAAFCQKHNLKAGRLNIAPEVVQWVRNGDNIQNVLDKNFKYKCGGDSMHHVAKPVHGFRFDGVRHLLTRRSSAYRIGNIGYLGSEMAGNYLRSHDAQVRPGYQGCDAIGWNFSHVVDSCIGETNAMKIYSDNGNAVGYRFINGCRNTQLIYFKARKISAGMIYRDGKWFGISHKGNKVEYDANMPSPVPNAIGVKVEDDNCRVKVRDGCACKLYAPGCRVPIWLSTV
jgi:hypothetical protein